IPADFHNQLMEYTSHGYRVIALAYRPLSPSVSLQSAQKLNRGEFEYDLQFLGLLVMENRLKPETVGSIGTLLGAKIRPVMVTGDNILTALSVARECGIIADTEAAVIVQTSDGPNGPNVNFVVYGDPRRRVTEAAVLSPSSPYRLAISGASWQAVRQHFSQLIPRLAVCGAVFARFSPVQKSQLVECLQELGYTVAMCGDGANDCGALKTAHAGISLSEAEASVASPFTSKEQNISCVIRLIQEGRCALVTSFGIFKFMACYSMCQFVSVLILYWIATNLTDNQFVYIDLFIITTLFVTFSYTAACESIAQEAPSHRLLSFVTCSSIALQCGIFVAFQTLAYFYVRWQSWFYPFVYDSNSDQMACYENTAVFLISVNQYIILAVVFSKSAPYRRSMLTNYAFMINIAIVVGVNLFVIFAPTDWLGNLLETWDAPRDNPNLSIKFVLVGAILMNFLIAFLVEQLVESVWFSRLVHRAGRRLISKPKEFERVARQLKLERGEWPPISVHFQRTGQRELLNFVAQGGGGSADEAVKPNQVSVEIKPMEADRPRADSEQQKKKKKKKYYTALKQRSKLSSFLLTRSSLSLSQLSMATRGSLATTASIRSRQKRSCTGLSRNHCCASLLANPEPAAPSARMHAARRPPSSSACRLQLRQRKFTYRWRCIGERLQSRAVSSDSVNLGKNGRLGRRSQGRQNLQAQSKLGMQPSSLELVESRNFIIKSRASLASSISLCGCHICQFHEPEQLGALLFIGRVSGEVQSQLGRTWAASSSRNGCQPVDPGPIRKPRIQPCQTAAPAVSKAADQTGFGEAQTSGCPLHLCSRRQQLVSVRRLSCRVPVLGLAWQQAQRFFYEDATSKTSSAPDQNLEEMAPLSGILNLRQNLHRGSQALLSWRGRFLNELATAAATSGRCARKPFLAAASASIHRQLIRSSTLQAPGVAREVDLQSTVYSLASPKKLFQLMLLLCNEHQPLAALFPQLFAKGDALKQQNGSFEPSSKSGIGCHPKAAPVSAVRFTHCHGQGSQSVHFAAQCQLLNQACAQKASIHRRNLSHVPIENLNATIPSSLFNGPATASSLQSVIRFGQLLKAVALDFPTGFRGGGVLN
uniref:P-type phospholipid transporter n=1 Tax=Macrostomum lignano TaxID=282301 RepID=A0A1I8ITS8_9PLAT